MRLRSVRVGNESKSGLAVLVTIDDEDYWVPLSQVSYIRRNPKVKDEDEIEIADWWCKRHGLMD